MNDFLAANKMLDTFQATEVGGTDAERPLSQNRQWINSEPVQRIEWKLGPDQRFQQFAVTTSAMYVVTALVQHIPETPYVRAYVYAFRGG
jgi:hypothetical protein